MKFAILGSGQVGSSLGAGLARHGHTVVMGSRDPSAERVVAWAAEAGDRASAASYADAAAGCEVAVVATVWTGTENALRLAGPSNLAGKIVIDVTNPLGIGPNGPALVLGHTDSGGEQVQRWLPESRVVKTWNTVNHLHMIDPAIPGGPGDMFYCGDDADAKVVVADLLDQCGWPSIDVGGIDGARLLEPMTILWVRYAMGHSTSNHAFKLLHP
jgi:8-hydroxy-5-deazaflavin:NADPH oxidoreductase